MAFDKILDAVKNDVVEAGLLIHEGQLLFPQLGMHRVVDLGVWWHEQTGLPLPLGGNAVRRALGPASRTANRQDHSDSVEYGLEHREEALNYAMQFARDMETEVADKFVGMYVNQLDARLWRAWQASGSSLDRARNFGRPAPGSRRTSNSSAKSNKIKNLASTGRASLPIPPPNQ